MSILVKNTDTVLPAAFPHIFAGMAMIFLLCPSDTHAQEDDLTDWQKPTADCTQEGERQFRCDPTAVYIAEEPAMANLRGAGASVSTVSGEGAQDYDQEHIFMITTMIQTESGSAFRSTEDGRAFIDGREAKIRLYDHSSESKGGRKLETLTWFISPKAMKIASSAESFHLEFGGTEIRVATLLPQIREMLRMIGGKTEYDGSGESGRSGGRARGQLDELGVRYSKASFFDRIKRGDRKVVELFLEAGMSADAINSEGKSALVIAVREAERDIVELLLGEKANPNGRDRREEEEGWTDVKNLGNSPLEAAHWSYTNASESNEMMRTRYVEIIKLLLDEGANVDIESKAGNTLLSNAAGGLQPDLVDLYLEYGADANHLGSGGETPLTTIFDALPTTDGSSKKAEVTQMLLEAGADVNHQNRQGNTALMKAGASDSKTVNLLLRHGANPNLKNRQGETPLLETVRSTVGVDGVESQILCN